MPGLSVQILHHFGTLDEYEAWLADTLFTQLMSCDPDKRPSS
jgi:hypothetical protein